MFMHFQMPKLSIRRLLHTTYDEGVDLSAYDGALKLLRGGTRDAEDELGA